MPGKRVKDWTIDTTVLYCACAHMPEGKPKQIANQVRKNDAKMSASSLLMLILDEEHRVAFDEDGQILGEYRRCLEKQRTPGSFITKWFVQTLKLADYYVGDVPNDHDGALKRLRFHRKDFVFVAVAAQTNTRRLVVEGDSDYTRAVKEYLKRKMDVRVLSCCDACQDAHPIRLP